MNALALLHPTRARIEQKFPGASVAAGRHVELNMLVMRIEADEIGVVAQTFANPVDIVESLPAKAQAETAHPSGVPFLFGHLLAIGAIPADIVYLEAIDFLLGRRGRADVAVLKKFAPAEIRMRLAERDEFRRVVEQRRLRSSRFQSSQLIGESWQ